MIILSTVGILAVFNRLKKNCMWRNSHLSRISICLIQVHYKCFLRLQSTFPIIESSETRKSLWVLVIPIKKQGWSITRKEHAQTQTQNLIDSV